MRPRFGLRPPFWVAAALALGTSAVALVVLQAEYITAYVGLFGLLMAIYGFAVWCTVTGRLHAPGGSAGALPAILLVAALLRGIALFAPQNLSTDVYRYIWDGRVEGVHVNPYRYVPADPALAPLRDAAVYPNINRADYAHTIYPPAAQLAFLGITRVSDGVLGMKLGMLAFESVAIAALLALLRAYGLPESRILLYAWHPLPIWEFAGAGHVDAVGIALLLLAFLAAARGARWLSGVALAAATLVKYYPVIEAPVLYRRWDWRMPLAFVATVAVLYLPFLSVGSAVFGFIPGYAAEEGLEDGRGLWLLWLWQHVLPLPPHPLRFVAPLAAAVLLGFGLWWLLSRRARRESVFTGALLLAGVFMLLTSPHYPWYFAWMVPFLCFRLSLAHLWLTASCALMYVWPYPDGVAELSYIYLPFVLLLLVQRKWRTASTAMETFDAHRTA